MLENLDGLQHIRHDFESSVNVQRWSVRREDDNIGDLTNTAPSQQEDIFHEPLASIGAIRQAVSPNSFRLLMTISGHHPVSSVCYLCRRPVRILSGVECR